MGPPCLLLGNGGTGTHNVMFQHFTHVKAPMLTISDLQISVAWKAIAGHGGSSVTVHPEPILFDYLRGFCERSMGIVSEACDFFYEAHAALHGSVVDLFILPRCTHQLPSMSMLQRPNYRTPETESWLESWSTNPSILRRS